MNVKFDSKFLPYFNKIKIFQAFCNSDFLKQSIIIY